MHGTKTDKMIVAIHKSTVSVGDLNTPLSVTDRIRKISKKDLNNVNQTGLVDIYNALHHQLQNAHSFQVYAEKFPI